MARYWVIHVRVRIYKMKYKWTRWKTRAHWLSRFVHLFYRREFTFHEFERCICAEWMEEMIGPVGYSLKCCAESMVVHWAYAKTQVAHENSAIFGIVTPTTKKHPSNNETVQRNVTWTNTQFLCRQYTFCCSSAAIVLFRCYLFLMLFAVNLVFLFLFANLYAYMPRNH